MKKAIFFDLDGTLWNALEPLLASYNQTMVKNNYPYRFTLDKVKSYMGLTPEETVVLAFPDLSVEEGLKIFKQMYQDELVYLNKHPGNLYPHVKEVLSILKNKYHLYIVSNADKGYAENFMDACKLQDYFEGFLQAGDTGLDKHDNIKLLKQKEKIDEVIYLGDTLKDKIESTKAGVKFIHAAYGFGLIEDDPYKIDNLMELPNLVDKLFDEKRD